MLGLIALLCFVTVALGGYSASVWMQQRQAARRAVVNRLRSLGGSEGGGQTQSLLKDQRLSGIPFLDTVLGRIPIVTPLVRMIQQAGLRRRVGEVLLYVPLLGSIAYLLVTILGGGLLVRFVFAAMAATIPLLIVARMRRRRAQLFAEQLPDALDLVRSALQAGHGLLSAFQVVSETLADPVAQEFRYIVDEVRLGLPLRDALYNLAGRIDDQNLPILVIGILTAQEVGGNMAEVIENVTYTIREREKLFREVRVMTAQGRLSGLVLTLLPFLVGTFMFVASPSYFEPMITKQTGHYLLLYALTSIIAGHFVIRRLVRIQV